MVHISEKPEIRDHRGKKLMLYKLELKFPDELNAGDSVWCRMMVASGASWLGELWFSTPGYLGIKYDKKDCKSKHNVTFTPAKCEKLECSFTMPEKDVTVTFYGGHEEAGKWVEDFSREEVLKLKPAEPPPPQKTPVKKPKKINTAKLTPKNYILSYPRTAKKLLPAGETIIELKKKKNITFPDGTSEDINTGYILPLSVELCKSATIYTDADIAVDFLLEGAITYTGLITPPGARLRNVWYDHIEIKEDHEALFYISMSTLPDGAPEDVSLERPVSKDSKFNEIVTADTDIFDDDLSPLATPTYFRIYAAFDAAGVLTVRRTKSGATVSENLNSGANLVANAAYVFDIIVDESETIQLRYSVNATALKLIVEEIGAGI